MFEITGADLFFKYPVANFTFDGILSPILAATKDMKIPVELPPFDKFGWFYEVRKFILLYLRIEFEVAVFFQSGETLHWIIQI